MKAWKRINKSDRERQKKRIEEESKLPYMERIQIIWNGVMNTMDRDLFRSFSGDGTSKKRRKIMTLR